MAMPVVAVGALAHITRDRMTGAPERSTVISATASDAVQPHACLHGYPAANVHRNESGRHRSPRIDVASSLPASAPDLQGSANPIPFYVVALVPGLMGHMMNSVILAVIFGLIVMRLALSAAGTIGLGMTWGVAVFAMMWFVVVPSTH